MEISLDKDSFHARFYKKSYGCWSSDPLPQSICNYSWGLAWAIVWLPISWWAYMWAAIPFLNVKNRDYFLWARVLTGICSYLIVGLVIFIIDYWIENPDDLIETLIIVGLIVLIVAVVVAIIWFFTEIFPPLKKKMEKSEGYKITSGTWYSIKNKVCPKIDWSKKPSK